MEKRNYTERKSKRVKALDELVVEKVPETVRLILLKDLKLNYTGPKSGKLYRFSGAGAEIDVDAEDVEIMMQKSGGECCPGGSGPQPYFAIV